MTSRLNAGSARGTPPQTYIIYLLSLSSYDVPSDVTHTDTQGDVLASVRASGVGMRSPS